MPPVFNSFLRYVFVFEMRPPPPSPPHNTCWTNIKKKGGERPGAVRRPWKPAWGRPPAMESGLQYLTSRLSKQAWRVWGVWDSLSRPCGGVGGGGGDGKGPIGHPFGPFNGQKSLSPLWKARFSLSTPSMGRVMGFPRLKITMSATFTEYSV
jgi:hypothetical protein